MAQRQTKKAEQGKEPLKCTFGDCQKLQCADGEFCKKHIDIDDSKEKEKTIKKIKKFLRAFDNAQDEDWFEWMQTATDLLVDAKNLLLKDN